LCIKQKILAKIILARIFYLFVVHYQLAEVFAAFEPFDNSNEPTTIIGTSL
jgi:hypothetical protein